ncbi:membrane protein [Agaricicola taiwanensis]|uniref:Membrane protein n=1 Tax=Agaricicola taiwanensis TaxID=591372 RepID=A0A8J2VXJ6_9RHOB|nr:outer membrane protein [Agaricicola taiwanensis]GGE40348.1 membrane protein [Agaricicola taiwanensis]
MLKHTRILVAAAAILGLPAAAMAADLPVQQQAPAAYTPVASVYDWSGVYLGAHAGYGWGDIDTDLPGLETDADGFLGGLQAGYNAQWGNWVGGVELEASYSGIEGDDVAGIDTQLNWLGTARVRVGYAFDRVLPYVTGGLALGEVEVEDTVFGFSESNTHLGWTVGAGVEVAVADNISVKGEYSYIDLQDEDYNLGLPVATEAGLDAHTFKVGLNYKF